MVGGLVTLNECRYQLCWCEVFAHVYPGLHCLGCTLTHEGRREFVEESLKPFEATATLLREQSRRKEWVKRGSARKRENGDTLVKLIDVINH